mmetsp:Transcript_20384/g.36804  ORF Transcript_20384/g.36804 Transcript_20384/m.36804 type:complete len:211 (+) Transcript_20384:476-1108(+)
MLERSFFWDMAVFPALIVTQVPALRYINVEVKHFCIANGNASFLVNLTGIGCFFLSKNLPPRAFVNMGNIRSSAKKTSNRSSNSRRCVKLLCFLRRDCNPSTFLIHPSCSGNLAIISWTHGLDSSLTMRQASTSWRLSSSSSMASPLSEEEATLNKGWGISIRIGFGLGLPGMRARLNCTWTSRSFPRSSFSDDEDSWCLSSARRARSVS